MLQLIVGASGTGKTQRVLEGLRTCAERGVPSMLLVPEQFTAAAETMVYTQLGDALCAHVEVYSFTSLAEEVLRRHGGVAVRTLDDAARVVTVRRAIDSLAEALPGYRKHRRSTSFCSMCADAIKELKIAGATPEFVVNTAQSIGAEGEKLRELGLIFGAYEGAIQSVAADPSDRVSLAAQRFSVPAVAPYFVYIDNFDGFTAPEYDMLQSLVQAQCCTVTLCCAQLYDKEDGLGLFSPVQRTGERLRRVAARSGVPVAPPVVLGQDLRHRSAPQLAALGAALCGESCAAAPQAEGMLPDTSQMKMSQPEFSAQESSAPEPLLPELPLSAEKKPPQESFFLTPAEGIYDECKTVASEIARLVHSGAAYREIAVICRRMDVYEAALHYELGLADIPYFADETTTLEHCAPAAFVRAALALAARGVSSELVLRLLKTDLAGFAPEDIAALENYAYTWELRAADWRAPFTRSAAGLGTRTEPQDEAALAAAERVRAALMPKLEAFLAQTKGVGGIALTKALYTFLQALEGEENTRAEAEALRAMDEPLRADALTRAYNTLMTLLDEMALLLGDDETAPEEYDELFLLLLRESDIGHVPQTQNAVIVTTADRMRLAGPHYCFVLGASEGEFPKTVGYSGLLSHTDRELLVKSGLEMPGSYENRTLLEQMFFYRALTAASEGVYVSYVSENAGGAPLCAALAPTADALYPKPLALTLAEKAPTRAAALDLLGRFYRDDTPEVAALAAALGDEPALEAMRRAAVPQPFAARNEQGMEALLGRDLYLTPTRVEQYYKCRFGYFLEYVLRLRARKKAELSPLESGSFVHAVLERVMREAGAGFAALSEAQLRELAQRAADAYVAEFLPGAGTRFAYLLERLREGTLRLLLYLQQEQAQSSFHPVAYEQPLGAEEGAVTPLSLHTPEGRTVRVVGTIDRVDVMERGGSRYFRVVDYKTGNKEFRLDLVYCGLDLQMLLYLFAVCAAAPQDVPAVPAGVLYVLGDPAPKSVLRAAAPPPAYQVDGLILDDAAVVRGMDKEATGLFVPLRFTRAQTPYASQKLAGLEKLGAIRNHVETLVLRMAEGLYGGDIAALPLLDRTNSPCTPCQYRAVCRHEDGVQEASVFLPEGAFKVDEGGKEGAAPKNAAAKNGAEAAPAKVPHHKRTPPSKPEPNETPARGAGEGQAEEHSAEHAKEKAKGGQEA